MKQTDRIVMANRIAALELELRTIPHGPKTRDRRHALQRELLKLQDKLENGPAPSYDPAADPLYEGLANEPEPAPADEPAWDRPFEPSQDDRAWWAAQPSRPLPRPSGGPAHGKPSKPSAAARMWGYRNWTGRGRRS